MRALLAGLLIAFAAPAAAHVQVLEHAEMSLGWVGGSPGAQQQWDAIDLPHNWSSPSVGHGWTHFYRIRFHSDRRYGQSIYLPKVRLYRLNLFVNGRPIWRSEESFVLGFDTNALQIPIQEDLLRDGENVLELVATGSSYWHNGIPRVYIGDSIELARWARTRLFLQDHMMYMVAAAFGAIGLLSLFLWIAGNRDPVLFWYAISGLTVMASTGAWYFTLVHFDVSTWRIGLQFLRYHGYLVPIFVLHLRLAGRRSPWLEGILWTTMVWAFFSVSASDWMGFRSYFGWGITFSILPALFIVPLLRSPALRTKGSVQVLVLADIAAGLLPLHDWAWRLGFLDYDRPYLVYYAPAFVMLAAAAPIIQRARASVRAAEENRLELERRVAEKTREIEDSHEKLREVQHQAALAEERRRIMADMHDGLGARLVALLSVAQSGKAKHGEISEGLAAALDELRLTVDSVQPVEGDVGVVLGNVRHRMRSVFERAGIRLVWNVSALPPIDNLTPERILAIQRIFLEVFSNAIRHSQARTVTVFTMRVPGAARIVIEDDGCGFDCVGEHAGMGLHNLQMRAAQAGGTLQVESQAGKGTRITLSLPIEDGDAPEPLPNIGQETANYPVGGMVAEAASS